VRHPVPATQREERLRMKEGWYSKSVCVCWEEGREVPRNVHELGLYFTIFYFKKEV